MHSTINFVPYDHTKPLSEPGITKSIPLTSQPTVQFQNNAHVEWFPFLCLRIDVYPLRFLQRAIKHKYTTTSYR